MTKRDKFSGVSAPRVVSPAMSIVEADQLIFGTTENRAIQPMVSADGTIVDYGQFRLTATGLQVNGEITAAQWQQIGEVLTRAKSAVKWWIGDWINNANPEWGSTYDEAVRITNYSLRSLQNIAYIASNVDFSLRREKLSFTHYSMLAPLASEEQANVIARLDQMWADDPTAKPPTVGQFYKFIYGRKKELPAAPISRKYSTAFSRIRKAIQAAAKPKPRDIQLLRELVEQLERDQDTD